MTRYDKGLFEVADNVHAYLQPDGGWGWSNAGLVAGAGESLLVDTLFDLVLTREMLDAMAAPTTGRPIRTVVNTHANGDHCYGNELLAGPGVEFLASAAAAREMDETPPEVLAGLVAAAPSLPAPLGAFVTHAFGAFSFDGISPPAPTSTFTNRATCDVGGTAVELLVVGPAHTAGDVIAWLPEQRVVFSGDILFIGSTPIMWAGPVDNWLAACDRVLSLEPTVIVPGHGPLTNADGVREMASYLRFVADGVAQRFDAGLSDTEATRDLFAEVLRGPYASWKDRERLAVNVATLWAQHDPSYQRPSILELFTRMAHLV